MTPQEQRIVQLAEQGRTAEAIAKRVGVSVKKVRELIGDDEAADEPR